MPKSSRSQNSAAKSCRCLSLRCLSILAIFLALFSALYSYLNARLEQFYIFEPGQLHDLSQRAIAAHGNDTRSVVNYIVSELDEKVPSQFVNKEEEWVFNNAGGAMGAMYIIHASKFLLSLCPCVGSVPWIRTHGPGTETRASLDQSLEHNH